MTTRKASDTKAPASKPARTPGQRPAGAAGATGKSGRDGKDGKDKPVAERSSPAKPVAGQTPAGKPALPAKPAVPVRAAAAAGKPGATGGKPAGKAPEGRTPASLAKAALKNAESARKAAPKKSPYTRTQLTPLRRALLELRTRMLGDLNQMEKEALRADDPDVDVENVADHGSDAFERHMTLGLMEGEVRTLRQIVDAIEAMNGGRYGLCSTCGGAIPLARLEAIPFAQTCVPCQEAHERRS